MPRQVDSELSRRNPGPDRPERAWDPLRLNLPESERIEDLISRGTDTRASEPERFKLRLFVIAEESATPSSTEPSTHRSQITLQLQTQQNGRESTPYRGKSESYLRIARPGRSREGKNIQMQ